MYKQSILSLVFVMLSSVSLNLAAQVEGVYGLAVKDPGAVVMALDRWNASKDSDGGQTVTLYESMFNGEDPSTHVIVAEYKDYAAFEKQRNRMRSSGDFAQLMRTVSSVTKPTWEAFTVHQATWGKGWHKHSHVAVVSMRVKNPGAYAAALDEMMTSKAGKSLKGTNKLISIRAGTGSSHVVAITGNSFAEINEGMDALFASEEFAAFAEKVGDIRKVRGTAFYKVVKRWKH